MKHVIKIFARTLRKELTKTEKIVYSSAPLPLGEGGNEDAIDLRKPG